MYGDLTSASLMYSQRDYFGSNTGILPVLKNNWADAYFQEYYYINAKVSENKQRVGMLFLHFLLSEYAQTSLYVHNTGSLPLNKASMESLFALYPMAQPMEPYFAYSDEAFGNLPWRLIEQIREKTKG